MYCIQFPVSISIFITFSSVISRKYDLDQEAQRLYKESFQSVLMRFRRTPDYLKILSEKQENLNTHIEEIKDNMQTYYIAEITKRVAQILGIDIHDDEASTTSSPSYYYRALSRKQNNDEELEGNETQHVAIKRLDTYPMLSSSLSLTERNSFRDLGFEYAGRMIHTLIASLDPTDSAAPKSTKAPAEGTEVVITKHVSVHEVTKTTVATVATPTEEGAESTLAPPHDKYRHRARARVVSRDRNSNALLGPME